MIQDRFKYLADKYFYDSDKAEFVKNFIYERCHHVEGEWAGKPFELLDFQWEDIIKPVFGLYERKGGPRLIKECYIEIPKKNGKALDLDTKILTPSGYKRMEDIKYNDYVYGSDGKPTRVTYVSEIMHRPCYSIIFSGGVEIIACEDHLWEIHSHDWVRPRVIDTKTIFNSYLRDKNGDKLMRVKASPKVQFINHLLKIDPYVLGVWLGDGTSASANVTISDEDSTIFEYFEKVGYPVKKKVRINRTNTFKVGGYNQLMSQLRYYGLVNNKHIPEIYLITGEYDRRLLLNGLMDTDGYISKSGQCVFTNQNRQLAYDCLRLVISLGYKASIFEKPSMLNGVKVATNYNVQFFAPITDTIFRLRRKQIRLKKSIHETRSQFRTINHVEYIGTRLCKCITVEAEDKLYLATEYNITTHNTTLLAGLENYLLFGDGEPGAQVYNCAGDDSQAELLFRTAKYMVINDHILKANSQQLRTEIRYKNNFIKKLTSKAETKHGINAHAVIYDELHAATDQELYDTLKYAGAQRRSPIFFQITTAGYDRTSICWARHEYTRQINEGIFQDDQFWGVIYSAKDDDDPFDPETWSKANPIYRHSETFRKNFAKDAVEAKNNITVLNAFKRLRLNIWTGSNEKWISDVDWNKGNAALPDLTGRTCYAGLDLASTSDTASLVFIFPIDDKYYVLPYIFVPERMINERDSRNETFYFKWATEGHLIRTPGNVIDYNWIEKVFEESIKKYNVFSVGYDPFNARQKIMDWIDIYGIPFEEYRQGWATMSEPTKEFERLLMDGKIVHGGHPVLRWMADNAMLRKDVNDNYMVGKGKISKDKVDAVIAAIIAMGECIRFREKAIIPSIDIW